MLSEVANVCITPLRFVSLWHLAIGNQLLRYQSKNKPNLFIFLFMMGCILSCLAGKVKAAPFFQGEAFPIGEPVGDPTRLLAHQITITFDLIPLDSHRPAQVRVDYELENKGDPVDLSLKFFHGGNHQAIAVLNRIRVPVTSFSKKEVPNFWSLSPYLRSPAAKKVSRSNGFQVKVKIPQGKSHLVVLYHHPPGVFSRTAQYYRSYSIAYVLPSSSLWRWIGQFDVFVKAQPGWEVQSSLPFVKRGTTWSSGFPSRTVKGFVINTNKKNPGQIPFQGFYLFISFLLSATILTIAIRSYYRHLRKGKRWRFFFLCLGLLVSILLCTLSIGLEKWILDVHQLVPEQVPKPFLWRLILCFGFILLYFFPALFLFRRHSLRDLKATDTSNLCVD